MCLQKERRLLTREALQHAKAILRNSVSEQLDSINREPPEDFALFQDFIAGPKERFAHGARPEVARSKRLLWWRRRPNYLC